MKQTLAITIEVEYQPGCEITPDLRSSAQASILQHLRGFGFRTAEYHDQVLTSIRTGSNPVNPPNERAV